MTGVYSLFTMKDWKNLILKNALKLSAKNEILCEDEPLPQDLSNQSKKQIIF